ncbi:LamG-like jellyroll fold domain-containing protein [Pedosphaera parvula]|uniref:LamG domain protein jellyroll fold domain protein n=1 Tax=Pedosphaera parvula (strain Ellin514) TaxID=320771 RepID=B9XPB8_PEDPL|nr:LamG-like jellyroll fold domain-containing protein [Pedosphaera parvula]EEF58258.1 hypothetical protein Cflav_PD0986 [Pedosphaera parvula Ellin514]
MKNLTRYTQTLLRVLSVLLLCLAINPASAQPGPPPLPTVLGSPLTFWRFDDTNWLSTASFPPLVWTNLDCVPSWDGNALQVDSPNPAGINYKLIESNGRTNLTLESGTLCLWFKPNWTSTNLDGTGPGDFGRLIDVGLYTTNAAYGWWSLNLDPAGTYLSFSAQTNGAQATYLCAPIAWTADAWHLITLAYSSSNSALYLDGQLATNGPGVTYWPGPGVLTNGFYLGSDYTGWQQAHGQFENLKTWNYPLDATPSATTTPFTPPTFQTSFPTLG